ncbi:MAG: dihydrolipoamide acetyltransferase family protein [Gemmatimonadales bacterium]|jgi:pyruvate dehydrogenase E2 component (dihydrolipoamide acetyltransferase)
MATKVFMEALSPTMEEGKLLAWLKQEGDEVTNGDVLAEVETDKAVMELQARGAGVLRKILAPEGSTVEVGKIVAVIADADEDIEQLIAGADAALASAPAKPAPAPKAQAAAPAPAPAAPKPAVPAPAAAPGARVKASPLARRMAAERGVDLSHVQGSGPGGRIVMRDLEGAVPEPAPVPLAAGGYEDIELSQMRKTIARRLVESIGPIPHFFLTAEADMDRASDARDALNARDASPRISYNDIILKVVAAALLQHRECNAWWMDGTIRYFDEVHLSMAVAIDDGLITPVIRNAHLKSLREIAVETRELAGRARERKLTPEEYTGGTFSVSNLGMFEIDQFTGIINPPEAGLLAVGTIFEKPVVDDGELVVSKRMRITMSCDHRVIDGATGARCLQTIKRMLENPLAIVY